jgi:hypothetical protein
MSLNLKSLLWLLFMLGIAVVIAAFAVALRPAHAHLADRPDLDNWAHGLHAGSYPHAPCCDGSDAEPIKDADWDASTDGRYRVKINGEWIDVPPGAVVLDGNRYGQTLVWGYPSISGQPPFIIRCFLPGAGG